MKFAAVAALFGVAAAGKCHPESITLKFWKDENCKIPLKDLNKMWGKVQKKDYHYYSGECEEMIEPKSGEDFGLILKCNDVGVKQLIFKDDKCTKPIPAAKQFYKWGKCQMMPGTENGTPIYFQIFQ